MGADAFTIIVLERQRRYGRKNLWETISAEIFTTDRKYPLPHPDPLDNVINDPYEAKEDMTENEKGGDDDKFNDNGSCSFRCGSTTPIDNPYYIAPYIFSDKNKTIERERKRKR